MEVSQALKDMIMVKGIPLTLLEKIERYSLNKPEEESCGIILKNKNNLIFKPCENLAVDKKMAFYIDPFIMINESPLYIFHSHPISSSKPSVLDMKISDELCIPFLIYSIKDKDFFLYENMSVL